jgi:AraC-like DNA-binding protein
MLSEAQPLHRNEIDGRVIGYIRENEPANPYAMRRELHLTPMQMRRSIQRLRRRHGLIYRDSAGWRTVSQDQVFPYPNAEADKEAIYALCDSAEVLYGVSVKTLVQQSGFIRSYVKHLLEALREERRLAKSSCGWRVIFDREFTTQEDLEWMRQWKKPNNPNRDRI